VVFIFAVMPPGAGLILMFLIEGLYFRENKKILRRAGWMRCVA
jgi:hypothetical protein